MIFTLTRKKTKQTENQQLFLDPSNPPGMELILILSIMLTRAGGQDEESEARANIWVGEFKLY